MTWISIPLSRLSARWAAIIRCCWEKSCRNRKKEREREERKWIDWIVCLNNEEAWKGIGLDWLDWIGLDWLIVCLNKEKTRRGKDEKIAWERLAWNTLLLLVQRFAWMTKRRTVSNDSPSSHAPRLLLRREQDALPNGMVYRNRESASRLLKFL